jgi:trk system potassium uptake protein TrkH
MLGLIAVLIGASMAFSLPWAWYAPKAVWQSERPGFFALLGSMAICFAVGGGLRLLGRRSDGQLFRKEAMAVVGLSWVLATVLGALPFALSGTRMTRETQMSLFDLTFVDAMFEAQSGFSTTGATVLTDLEVPDDPDQRPLVPRCILFWRSSTHFLGGLGIIVLFVAILGQGSAGKALMQAEMPGPSHSTPQARMQHTAWVLFLLYAGLNATLTLLLRLEGLSLFDALCHAFGTMATGGFSTFNNSIGHFATQPGRYNGPLIEMTIVVFMFLAGTNFMLMYWVAVRKPRRLLADVEWRTYITVILLVTVLVVAVGLYRYDFGDFSGMTATTVEKQKSIAEQPERPVGKALRYGLFQVVSIMTTTGFCTDNSDLWNSFGRGVLLLLMFVGGCAGSTGGGLKVIRHILFVKILRLEVEQAFHPTVVRPLRLAGEPVEHQELRKNILVYFGLILAIFVASWLFTITFEPDSTWTENGEGKAEHKLIDAASCVAATLNNIGPGLGVIGATENYANFQWYTKILFIWLMMLGRLEIFVILVLFVPRFWRTQ